MAFVRWRGHCAQLLATYYQDGRSRQLCLANLHAGYAVPLGLRTQVAQSYPAIPVDWAAIDRALAAGPPGSPVLTTAQQTWLAVELQLRAWAQEPMDYPSDRHALEVAANVLTRWRAISLPDDT